MAAGLILNYTNLALHPPGASFSLSSHNEITLLISYLLYLNFKYADILYNKRFIACIHYLTGKEGGRAVQGSKKSADAIVPS